MSMIRKIFQENGGEYLARSGAAMPVGHRKALEAVMQCRTGARGLHVFECPECERQHIANSSCGNRHCPVCGHEKAAGWTRRQEGKLLPCHYFLATFTMPEGLRRVARGNQRAVYQAMMNEAAAALGQLQADRRFTGCRISGFTGVLHTWSRQLEYHPHVHFLIPGGGLDDDRKTWRCANGDFLVHVRALSRLFRGKMKAAMGKAGLSGQIPPEVWTREWVVHCKPAGSGRETIRYLGAYVFRVAIADSRIVAYEPAAAPGGTATVTFKYQKVGSAKWRLMRLPVLEFMRRFLQHVLPSGFVKIRHYGFMSPNFAVPIQRIRELICVIYELVRARLPGKTAPVKIRPLRCPACKAVMVWRCYIRTAARALRT